VFPPTDDRRIGRAVVVAALGYFVDIYDLILFSVIRTRSLRDLGISESDMLDRGVLLLDMQMGGMLLGGILWGMLGDLRGRISVLFGSIFLYSAANIANGFVDGVGAYAALRFIAGLGLAGELGAGITLVSELMRKETRGIGTTIVASVGILGGITAVIVAKQTDWRTSYWIGGALGLALLFLRVGVFESGLFEAAKAERVPRGSFISLFRTRARAVKYIAVICTGMPIWYATGILVSFSPEIMRALGFEAIKDPGDAVMYYYIGLAAGDLLSGLLSQAIHSRKKAVLAFQALTAGAIGVYFTLATSSVAAFDAACVFLGIGVGYWAVFVTMASEQFGTNVRATVTTTAPNFVRGALVPITALFQLLKPMIGVPQSALAVGAICLSMAALALLFLEETFGKPLDYLER
jgi:MFS transporter, putative metabolite:H+ symporter